MKLEDVQKQATQGPWKVEPLVWAKNGEATGAECLTPEVKCEPWATTGKIDMRLAAHAVNILPKLVGALERCTKGSGPDCLWITSWEIEQLLAEAKEVKV